MLKTDEPRQVSKIDIYFYIKKAKFCRKQVDHIGDMSLGPKLGFKNYVASSPCPPSQYEGLKASCEEIKDISHKGHLGQK